MLPMIFCVEGIVDLNKVRFADLSLVLVSLLWGAGFIAVEFSLKSGMPTSLIIALRFLIGTIAILLVKFKTIKKMTKQELRIGSIAGIMLFLSFFMQTLGQSETGVSNSAFLTAVYVVIVPFIVWIVKRKPPRFKMFILVFTTLAGVIILTYTKATPLFTFRSGDIYVLLCAMGFAIHIVYLGLKAKDVNPISITFLQLAVCTVLGTLLFFATDFSADLAIDWHYGLPSVLYLGIFSSAVCYFLQTWAQTMTTPSKAAIIMSGESLFGPLISIIIGFDVFRYNILIGGVLILGSVIISEIDFTKIRLNPKESA